MALQVLFIALAGLLVLLNAFFVLAEFAIVKVRATRMRELADNGNRTASLVTGIIHRLDAFLSTCQLGITLASLGLGWVGEPAFAKLLEPWLAGLGLPPAGVHSIAFGVSFAFITLCHTVLGELVPKSLSIRAAERWALFVARPLAVAHILLFPAMWILNTSSNLILRLFRVAPATETESAHSEEELKMILGASHEKGAVTLNRLLMMENVLDFGTLRVRDVMVPAAKVVALDATAPWEENLETITKSFHSRYPLRRPESKRFDFIVHIKDIAVEIAKRNGPPDLARIARSVQSVRAELPLEELLQHFHRNRSHLAMVEDPQGRFIGVVSLEDVVEELIGTVRDEFEKDVEVRLEALVPADAILTDLEAASKEAAIRALVSALKPARPEVDVDGVVQTIVKREALASTGLGEGIAIPHGRVPGLSRPAAAIGLCPKGLEFQSLDGKPARLIFLILTPSHDEGAHVHILGKISTLLASDYLRERMMQAARPEDVVEVLRTSDKALPA